MWYTLFHSTTSFRRENKILNVGSFIILRSGKRITSLIKEIRVLTFLVKYGKIKLCRKSIL